MKLDLPGCNRSYDIWTLGERYCREQNSVNAIGRLRKCTKLEQVKFETELPELPFPLNRRVVVLTTLYTE
jgi:hypothetical protein